MTKNKKRSKTWILTSILILIVGVISLLTIIRNLNTEIEIHSGTWEKEITYERAGEVKDIVTSKLVILDENFFDFEYESEMSPEDNYSYNGSYTWKGDMLTLSYFHEGKAYEDVYYLNPKTNDICKANKDCSRAYAKNTAHKYTDIAEYEKTFITPEEYQEKIANKDSFMLIVHADWCGACQRYEEQVLNAIGYTEPELYYISDTDAKKVLNVTSYPTTIIYINGEEVDKTNFLYTDDFRQKLLEYRFIEEE